jgi:peptidyl-prolyl cis-trans isomerase B (cyclophilin B)
MVTLKTNFGDIKIELYSEEAPVSCKNFLEYVKSGFYKDTLFHRVINGFMIQGGGMDKDFKDKKTNAPIKNEAANQLPNVRGSVAYARTQVVDSATSQFFINLVDNDFLNFRSPTPRASATAFSARLSKVWMWSIRSPKSKPHPEDSIRMFPQTRWSSLMLLRSKKSYE